MVAAPESGPGDRRIVNLTLDTLDDLPSRCRSCVFWELDPAAGERASTTGDPAFEKEVCTSATLLQWGSCGRLAYVGESFAGYVLFAPPAYLPRSIAFPTRPISPDAGLLATGYVHEAFTGQGIARALIQSVAKDLARRGFKAIEAYGSQQWERPDCVLPASFLRAVGFKTVRAHHKFPRLRLELPRALDWREDVEYALDQLLTSMRPPAPASTAAVG